MSHGFVEHVVSMKLIRIPSLCLHMLPTLSSKKKVFAEKAKHLIALKQISLVKRKEFRFYDFRSVRNGFAYMLPMKLGH